MKERRKEGMMEGEKGWRKEEGSKGRREREKSGIHEYLVTII